MKSTFLQGQDAKIITSRATIASIEQSNFTENVGLSATASGDALTVELKQADGSTDPTEPNPARIGYGSSTLTDASFSVVSTTANLPVVIPSTALLGYDDGDDVYVHVYGLLFSGATELMVVGSRAFDDDELVTTVVIGTGSDLGNVAYSTTQQTAVPVRYLGFFRIDAILTAGTWTAPDKGSLFPKIFPLTAYLKDIKATTVDGGGFTAGSPVTRVLNTVQGDSSIVVLSSNQFTLLPGRYQLESNAPAFLCNEHASHLRNVTDSTNDIFGTPELSSSTDSTQTQSLLTGTLDLDATKTFELQHECTTTRGTDGQGRASNLGNSEVYAQVKITKET